MKRLSLFLVFILCFLIQVQAQTEIIKANKNKFNLGIEAGFPNESMNLGSGFGLRLRYLRAIEDRLGFTFTSGAMLFFPKQRATLFSHTGATKSDKKPAILIPIKAGLRIMLDTNLYILLEGGASLNRTYGVTKFGPYNSPLSLGFNYHAYFDYAPTIGVRFDKYDLSIRYEGYVEDRYLERSSAYIGLSFGYDF